MPYWKIADFLRFPGFSWVWVVLKAPVAKKLQPKDSNCKNLRRYRQKRSNFGRNVTQSLLVLGVILLRTQRRAEIHDPRRTIRNRRSQIAAPSSQLPAHSSQPATPKSQITRPFRNPKLARMDRRDPGSRHRRDRGLLPDIAADTAVNERNFAQPSPGRHDDQLKFDFSLNS